MNDLLTFPGEPGNWFEFLWETYKLELVLTVLGMALLQSGWRYLKKRQGPGIVRGDSTHTYTVKLKPDHYKILLVICALMLVIEGLGAIRKFGEPGFRESLYVAGTAAIAIINTYRIGLKKLKLIVSGTELKINDKKLLSGEIDTIELWDDLIYFKDIRGREEKFWLKYPQSSFRDMSLLIKAIEAFCEKHQVQIVKEFDHSMVSNSTFKGESNMESAL